MKLEWRLPPNEIRVVFQRKLIRNFECGKHYCRHNDNGRKGYVIVFYLCDGYRLIFFLRTPPEGFVTHTTDQGQIIYGLHTIAAG